AAILSLFLCISHNPATSEIYTLSLHDALPIFVSVGPYMLITSPRTTLAMRSARSAGSASPPSSSLSSWDSDCSASASISRSAWRSEEHTSELQSLAYLVCRLLLEKKKHN